MKIDPFELFTKTLEINGKLSQLKQFAEECTEATLAVRKLERAMEEESFAGIERVVEREKELLKEIADVTIMVMQMVLIYGEDKIQPFIDEKLAKHQDWLNKKINSLK